MLSIIGMYIIIYYPLSYPLSPKLLMLYINFEMMRILMWMVWKDWFSPRKRDRSSKIIFTVYQVFECYLQQVLTPYLKIVINLPGTYKKLRLAISFATQRQTRHTLLLLYKDISKLCLDNITLSLPEFGIVWT